jgi:hypothetical protein
MHKSARLATTAGATVLTFVAMSGVAQADPVGDLTGGLTDTVGGVVNSVTGGTVRVSSPSRPEAESDGGGSDSGSGGSGGGSPAVSVDGPVHADVGLQARSSPNNGTQVNADVNAGVRSASGQGDAISAGVSVGVDTCGLAPAECDEAPPDTPPSPGPGAPSPGTPPGATGPMGGGPGLAPGATEATLRETLPITGGPLGALTGIGLLAVLTGSAAVAGSRIRARRDTE